MRLFSDAASRVDDPFLRRAFILAENGRGTTSPNPVVGCLVVSDGDTVGEGFHGRPGGPHAEVVALAQAAERARGATVYVTLEPCNHTGRTGPCTHALVSAGVECVVIGMADPNPRVAGCGAEALRASGIDVRFASDPTPFAEQLESWVKHATTGIPWLTAKIATTIDGRVSLAPGARTRITGQGGADVTRRLRAHADAVLVGPVTVAVDDPSLTVRDASGALAARQPLRVVLARTTVPPPASKVLTDGGDTVVLLPGHVEACLDAESQRYDGDEGVQGALRVLGGRGIVEVLAEPGPRMLAALVEADAVDELVVVQAGGFGGLDAPGAYEGAPSGNAAALEALFAPVECGIVGQDAVVRWRPREKHESRSVGHGSRPVPRGD